VRSDGGAIDQKRPRHSAADGGRGLSQASEHLRAEPAAPLTLELGIAEWTSSHDLGFMQAVSMLGKDLWG